MTDIWVCTSCKSINRERDSRCYSCGQRKEQVAAPEAPNVRLEAALANRSVNAYHSSLPFAVVAGVLISVVALLGVYLVFEAIRTLDSLRAAFLAAIASNDTTLVDQVLAEQRQPSPISLLHFPQTIVAVLAFGAWLSRVCLNIPVLGGGSPTWTPIKALVYPIIPIVNFVKVPGMVQDALYRLDPRAGGFFLVFAAFVGLVGSWLVGLFGTFAITANAVGWIASDPTRDGLVAAFGGVLDQTFLLSVITELMTAGGALLLVVIIARVESRAAARNEEIREAVLGGPSAVPGSMMAPVPALDPDHLTGDRTVSSALHEPQRSVPVYRPPATFDGPDPGPVPEPPSASDEAGPLLPPPPPA
jgi:hypothetical protein